MFNFFFTLFRHILFTPFAQKTCNWIISLHIYTLRTLLPMAEIKKKKKTCYLSDVFFSLTTSSSTGMRETNYKTTAISRCRFGLVCVSGSTLIHSKTCNQPWVWLLIGAFYTRRILTKLWTSKLFEYATGQFHVTLPQSCPLQQIISGLFKFTIMQSS